jgi:hypothetical protein
LLLDNPLETELSGRSLFAAETDFNSSTAEAPCSVKTTEQPGDQQM